MRILILGVSGLIGHKLLLELSSDFEVFGTLRKKKAEYGDLVLFDCENIIDQIDVTDFKTLAEVLRSLNPEVVLNCIGITKRKIDINYPGLAISVNSDFPHKLADWAKEYRKRIIHFSTDCVFDGKIGNYSEESLTTAEDIYGRTKALGELKYNHTLTIRSSFIGQELFNKTELLDWFLAQNGKKIYGFKNTYYSGVSTIFMAQVVKNILCNFRELSGIYQLAPTEPISKFDLLNIAKESFGVNVEIIPDEVNIHRPTLDGTKLKNEINLIVPSWNDMMIELALNREFYTN